MKEEHVVLRLEPALATIQLGAREPDESRILTARTEPAEPTAKDDPSVVATAPTMPVCLFRPTATGEPDASEVSWGISAIRADRSRLDGRGVKVAILDSGIDRSHPAFAGINMQICDFTKEGPADVIGHGTHCAGTIFGRDVEGRRIGVARGVDDVLVGKVIGENGGSSAKLLDAILWAVEKGAHVISMSLGIDFTAYQKQLKGSGYPDEIATSKALDGYRQNVLLFERLAGLIRAGAFLGRNALLVAASGNESRRDVDERFSVGCGPPAVSDGFLSVAAVGRCGERWRAAPFSNVNPSVAAPGVDIVSAALRGGLTTMSGTSMAAPHVAGVAAMLAQKHLQTGSFNPQLAAAQLMARSTVEQMEPGYSSATVGAGVVQAPEA